MEGGTRRKLRRTPGGRAAACSGDYFCWWWPLSVGAAVGCKHGPRLQPGSATPEGFK